MRAAGQALGGEFPRSPLVTADEYIRVHSREQSIRIGAPVYVEAVDRPLIGREINSFGHIVVTAKLIPTEEIRLQQQTLIISGQLIDDVRDPIAQDADTPDLARFAVAKRYAEFKGCLLGGLKEKMRPSCVPTNMISPGSEVSEPHLSILGANGTVPT